MPERYRPVLVATPASQELTDIARIARIGWWRWDTVQRVLTWSAELYHLAGRDPSSPPPTFDEHLAWLAPAPSACGTHPIQELLETGGAVEFDTEVVRPGGQRIWLFNRAVADRGPDGAIEAVRGILYDITDRKVTELNHDRLAAIVESADDAIIAADLDGTITAWNQGAERIYGYTAAEVIGRCVSLLPAADRRAEPQSLIARVRGGEASVHVNTVRARKNGQPLECSVTVTPLRDTQGGLVGVTAITRDTTESNQAARKVLDQETQFRALLDQGIAGIYILSDTGNVEYVNTGFAQMCGYTPDDLVGHGFLEFVAEADRPRVQDSFARTLAGHAAPIEAQIITRSGALQSVLAHATRAQHDGQPAVIGVLVDITERKETERALQRTNRLLRMITEGNEALVLSRTEADLTQRTCDVIVNVGGYQAASITLSTDGGLETAASAGDPQGRIRSADIPLKQAARTFGSLHICDAGPGQFADDELALMTEMGDDLAYGIVALRTRVEREMFTERLQRSMEDAIAALAATAEMRDPYTAGHQRHVAELATAIAREMGLDESRVHAIHLASVVHDIGKIKIPSELLTKPTRLTPVESQLMQTHVEAGYDILKGIDFPWPIAEFVLQHHERLDGSGYPNGLTAEDIHLEVKIIGVADVVDAMSAHRPYRFGKGLETTLADIEAGRGVLYDPQVVDACLKVFRSGFGFSHQAFA